MAGGDVEVRGSRGARLCGETSRGGGSSGTCRCQMSSQPGSDGTNDLVIHSPNGIKPVPAISLPKTGCHMSSPGNGSVFRMRRPTILALITCLSVQGVQAMFSVHDDVLAFPQYEIQFPTAIVSEAEAEDRLSMVQRTSRADGDGDGDGEDESYETMWLGDRKYLCKVPVVTPAPQLNATEKELSKVEEEKELARATNRGWELLSDLEGKCLYFVSGWWSYSFCHNREVRQFHQLPPQHSNQWPPAEDPETQSYVLGQVSSGNAPGQRGEGTELQATGELRFLVQKLGGGTTCDLTGKDRKIEVQFHCNSMGTDRIGWIKEVSICCYLMVIYTPRLCNDVAFLPPRENRAHTIGCQEIMNTQQIEEYHKAKATEEQSQALRLLQKGTKPVLASGSKSDGASEDDMHDEGTLLLYLTHEL